MMKTKLFAVVAATTLLSVPAIAQDVPHRAAVTPHANDVTATRHVRHASSGFWPGEFAAGVVGGAIGTAGAIASAPFRSFDNSYAYYGNSYYHDENAGYPYGKQYGYRISRNDLSGPICAPGTFVRGEDSLMYRCQ
jgi:hypothetical protein